ncbi:hypothetical protein R3I94_019505 [Phoxinus phoxinus]
MSHEYRCVCLYRLRKRDNEGKRACHLIWCGTFRDKGARHYRWTRVFHFLQDPAVSSA